MLPDNVVFKLGPVLVEQRKLYHAGILMLSGGQSASFTDALFEAYYRMIRGRQDLIHDAQQQALRDSLTPYYGRDVSVDLFRDLAWRFAGTKRLLEQGKALAPALFVGPQRAWVPLFIEDCELDTMSSFPRLKVEFRVCAGKYAGFQFTHSMSHFQLVRVFAKSLGFPKWKRANYRELVRCGLLAVLRCDDYGNVIIDEVDATPSLVSRNAKIRCERRRSCLLNEKSACHRCWRGYSGNEACKHACRRLSLIPRHCWKCDRDSWFRPQASETAVCEYCRLRAVQSQLVLEQHG